MKLKCLNTLLVCLFALIFGCARAPIRSSTQAMRPAKTPTVTDDENFEKLAKAISRDLVGLTDKYVAGQLTMRFGPRLVYTYSYAKKLTELRELLKSNASPKLVNAFIQKNFDFYEVYGDQKWGDVFVTGYYEPELNGRRKKTKDFSAPLLTLPKDAVTIDLPKFARDGVFGDCKGVRTGPCVEHEVLHGRLIGESNSRRVEPFEPRSTLVNSPLIKSQTHVLAWVDPIDEFFLEIQGSGQIDLPNLRKPNGPAKKIFVTYAGENGYPYVPIGKFLLNKIPRDQMTKDKIEEYLRSLTPAEAQELMDKNPSYVFFEKAKTPARTELGVTATSGRTIATDAKWFPKGALAFLEFQKPGANGYTPARRFVFDQDTGGAIHGGGRVDLFVGYGASADHQSGEMRAQGRLYYMVPK